MQDKIQAKHNLILKAQVQGTMAVVMVEAIRRRPNLLSQDLRTLVRRAKAPIQDRILTRTPAGNPLTLKVRSKAQGIVAVVTETQALAIPALKTLTQAMENQEPLPTTAISPTPQISLPMKCPTSTTPSHRTLARQIRTLVAVRRTTF